MGGTTLRPQSEASRHAAIPAAYDRFLTLRPTTVCGAFSPSRSRFTQ
jgi:hypothetical protein